LNIENKPARASVTIFEARFSAVMSSEIPSRVIVQLKATLQ